MDVEELQCEYERYRILVLNEFDRGMRKHITMVHSTFLTPRCAVVLVKECIFMEITVGSA